MQAGGGYLPADMICQFGVRTCADRTRATRWRVRLRLFESAIDAGARDTPHTRNTRQTITASNGGRECAAHRLAPVRQRSLALHRRDLAVEQLVVHGDLAHLRFQPG